MGPGPSPPTAAPCVEPSSNRQPWRSGTRRGANLGAPPAPAGLHARGLCLKGTELLSACSDLTPRAGGKLGRLLPRALSCAVLLLLLAAVLGRGWRCSIARILRQYRAVIFHEIQNLKNLSGSAERSSRAGSVCRSDKEQRILQSIYNISMSLRDVAGGALRGPEEAAVWKVVRDTEFVLRENCRRMGKSPPRPPPPPHRRRQQLKEITRKAQRLATCWEKLNVLHVVPRDS
ncbi:uncharacterized protein LOC136060179 [Cyrtonyx montezumae]|uniref:uncharacterized protein LOC136060179 n=1 Tax=Cyrtonyx montezumae TaxID=9017 RepID=UPI0032DA9BCF